MSAQNFGVVSIVLPNPQYDPSPNARIVNESYGYSLQESKPIQTLSANNPSNFDIIQGLLYVPDLQDPSQCSNQSLAVIPSNVTRRADFPPDDYPFVAIAPWTTIPCVQEYLSAMRADVVRGALFFIPDNSVTGPPQVNDPVWDLRDGGKWKVDNQFPVYALVGMMGSEVLKAMAQYSGNMTSAPFGEQLAQIYDDRDTVRLFARIDVNGTPGIPSLWVFLIIVLAVLLAVVLLTSVVMHLIQRRQRIVLQRRVTNGEVDLEALGIKRLNVPQELLDKMPQYVYTSKAEGTAAVGNTGTAVREVPFSQPTCPICLEDFVHGETTIRELPCNHIFHPECIDPFLRDNSSLCPMCKKSALPVGYCPISVTNLMVRRERLIRRMRARAAAQGLPPPHRFPAAISDLQRRFRSMSAAPTVPPPAHSSAADANSARTQMQTMRRSTLGMLEPVPADVQSQGRSAIRAWRREQLARRQAERYNEQATETRAADVSRPLWRRIAGRVFTSLE